MRSTYDPLRELTLYGPLAELPFDPQPSPNASSAKVIHNTNLSMIWKGKTPEKDIGAPAGMDKTTPPLLEIEVFEM
jgi:hypothetical protein